MSELQEPPPEVGAARYNPTRDAMRTLARCPTCLRESQLRNLAYKHKCKYAKTEADLEDAKQRRLKHLREKVTRRLTTTTGGEQGEQVSTD